MEKSTKDMTTDQEILIRLDRIEQMLAKLANLSLPPVDHQPDRLLRLARVNPEGSKESLREISRLYTATRRAAKKAATPQGAPHA